MIGPLICERRVSHTLCIPAANVVYIRWSINRAYAHHDKQVGVGTWRTPHLNVGLGTAACTTSRIVSEWLSGNRAVRKLPTRPADHACYFRGVPAYQFSEASIHFGNSGCRNAVWRIFGNLICLASYNTYVCLVYLDR
jgi:hypothetical protein